MPKPPKYTAKSFYKLLNKVVAAGGAQEYVIGNTRRKHLKPFSDITGPTYLTSDLTELAKEYIEELKEYQDVCARTLATIETHELEKRPFGKVNTYNPCEWLQEVLWWYTPNDVKFKDSGELKLGKFGWIMDKYMSNVNLLTVEQCYKRVNPLGSMGPLAEVKKHSATNIIWPIYHNFGMSELMCRFQYGGKTRVLNNLHGVNCYAESTASIPLNDMLLRSGLTYNGPILEAHMAMIKKWKSIEAKTGIKLDAYKFGPTVPTEQYISMVQWLGTKFGPLGYAACLPYVHTWVFLPLGDMWMVLKPPYSGTATGQPLNNSLGTILGLAPSLELIREGNRLAAVGSVDDQLIMAPKQLVPSEVALLYQNKAERYGVISDADEAEYTEGCVLCGIKFGP